MLILFLRLIILHHQEEYITIFIASEKNFNKIFKKHIGIEISEQSLAMIYLKALYNHDKDEYVMYEDIIPYTQDLLIRQNLL